MDPVKRLIAPIAALAVVAAACGSADTSDDVASLDETAVAGEDVEAVEETDVEEAVLAFTQCLREEGIEVDDPEFDGEGGFALDLGGGYRDPGGGGGYDYEEVGEAMDACGHLMEGVTQQFDLPDDTELQDDLLGFAECMRSNGIDVPDPDFSSDGPGGFFELDPEDPEVEAALEACQAEIAFGPG